VSIELDHVVVHVSDWETAAAFYREVVGAEVVEHPDGRLAFRFGRQQLNLHGPGVNTSLVARVPVAPGNSDLCFVWPGSPEEAVAHLEGHGVEVEAGPVARMGARGQGVSVYFRDPDGSLLELMSYERPPSDKEQAAGAAVQRPYGAGA
jgi:catechol 2,3-dioxygenase-like lactoylglutathione lyase family enzyme